MHTPVQARTTNLGVLLLTRRCIYKLFNEKLLDRPGTACVALDDSAGQELFRQADPSIFFYEYSICKGGSVGEKAAIFAWKF
jgi:hypothetical protein